MRHVYQHGKTVRVPSLALRYQINTRRQDYRCAVVVTKKVSKSAVTRNKIRRRIFEIVRTHAAEINKPYELVITIFNEDVASVESKKLDDELTGLLKKAGILTKPEPSKQRDMIERQEK